MKIRKCDICGYKCKDNGFTYDEPNMGYKIKITDLGYHWERDTDFEKFYICEACGKKLQDHIREWLRKEQTGENTRNQTTSSSDVSGTKMEGTSVEDQEVQFLKRQMIACYRMIQRNLEARGLCKEVFDDGLHRDLGSCHKILKGLGEDLNDRVIVYKVEVPFYVDPKDVENKMANTANFFNGRLYVAGSRDGSTLEAKAFADDFNKEVLSYNEEG